MTLLAAVTAPAEPSETGRQRHRRAWLEHVAVLALLVCWGWPLTHGVGGRDPHELLVFAVVLAVAGLALRFWRTGPAEALAAAAVAAAALAVCAVAPTGWWGADVAAGYVVAAASYLAVRRYAVNAARTAFVLAVVVLVGLEQFTRALLPWLRGQDPGAVMTGTFYWRNPFAAFLVVPALLGLGFALRASRPWRVAGWVAAPLCSAGVVFSSSRATMAVLVAGWVGLLGLTVRDRQLLRRGLALTALALAVVVALPGPPFFPHRASPLAALQQRSSAGQSLQVNGYQRTQFWREAVEVAAHHPVTGGGYHSLAAASPRYTPVSWARSQLAHDGYLQALTDGGLLLGLPFLALVAAIGVGALRPLARSMLRPRTPAEPLLAAATLGILASMVHSAVDFDWSHPAVLVQFAILAACRPALSHAAATGVVRAGRPPSRAAAAGAVALGAALAVSAGALHAWQHSERSAFTTTPVSEALAAAAAPFGDYRPAQMVLRTALAQPTAVPPGDVRRALAETGRAATVDVDLSLLRDAVAASYGLDPRAAVRAQALVDSLDGGPEPYVLGLATVYRSAGEAARGVELVRRQLAADAHLQVTDGQTPGELQFLAATAPGDYACLLPKLMALLGSGTPLPAADAPARGCAAVLRTGQASG